MADNEETYRQIEDGMNQYLDQRFGKPWLTPAQMTLLVRSQAARELVEAGDAAEATRIKTQLNDGAHWTAPTEESITVKNEKLAAFRHQIGIILGISDEDLERQIKEQAMNLNARNGYVDLMMAVVNHWKPDPEMRRSNS